MELDEQKQALKAMLDEHTKEGGMSIEQLKELMDAELSKDSVAIDTAYVDELAQMILELSAEQGLNIGKATPPRITVAHTPRRRSKRTTRAVVAIAAMLVIICSVAGACQWANMVKFFTPLMEQFGIKIGVPNQEECPVEIHKRGLEYPQNSLWIDWDEPIDKMIFRQSEIPQFLNGYPIIQPNLPKSYQFVYGQVCADELAITFTQKYLNNDDELFVQLHLDKELMRSAIWMIENNPNILGSEEVRIYQDCNTWIINLPLDVGYYLVWGDISEPELKMITEAIKGEIQ